MNFSPKGVYFWGAVFVCAGMIAAQNKPGAVAFGVVAVLVWRLG